MRAVKAIPFVTLALSDSMSVRTQIAAIREREEKRASCRVLADIFRRPRGEVEKMAADLDWDMHALQEQLSGPPKLSGFVCINGVTIPIDPRKDTAQDVAREAAKRGLGLLVRALPDGSLLFSPKGQQLVEVTIQHAMPYSEPVPMNAHMAESAAILRRAAQRTLHA